jgi:hypothetical protein
MAKALSKVKRGSSRGRLIATLIADQRCVSLLNEGKIVELGSPAVIRKSNNPVVVQFLSAALAVSSLEPDPEVGATKKTR